MDFPSPLLYFTTPVKEIRAYMPPVPVMISAASCVPKNGKGSPLRKPRLPEQVTLKAADCGGFVATVRWGGRYPFSLEAYLAWLHGWKPQWAAMFDLCCITPQRQDPGRGEVLRRQKFTTESAQLMWERCHHHPWSWCVTIQGYTPNDYAQHARELVPLIREMSAFYATPAWQARGEAYRFRVGIGSLCRPLPPKGILEIIRVVSEVIGDDIPLHLWGSKLGLLKACLDLGGVISLDTSVWNNLFAYEHEARRASGLSESQYSWQVSQPGYAGKVSVAQSRPKQSALQFDPLADMPASVGDCAVYDVYHAVDDTSLFRQRGDLWLAARDRAFWRVALVQATHLEEVFDLTTHPCDGSSWITRPQVLWVAAEGVRSTAVGDVLVSRATGEAWMVASHGFRELPRRLPGEEAPL